jgi:hypothetical protein
MVCIISLEGMYWLKYATTRSQLELKKSSIAVYISNHVAVYLAGAEVCLKHKLVQADRAVGICCNVLLLI